MDPRKLRKLLEILSEFGVKEYRTDKIQINLDPGFNTPVEEFTSTPRVFSMDDYDEPSDSEEQEQEVQDSDDTVDEYSDEQILHWSSRA